MASFNTDYGNMELDKLSHSLEFENQQYVKMIEKENQLIDSLQTQVCEKKEQMMRLEEEISKFDEDTKRLHKQYTANRDNTLSLRNTLDVMSDHEQALSKQLDIITAKNEEDSKFYKNQVANYTAIRDDYMRKYKAFPLAIELDKRKLELAAAQKKVEDIEDVKQDLKERIMAKEADLDNKILTRIVVKIAKTKLATGHLEKEIHDCLTEKTVLLEKLKDIQISKEPEQAISNMGEEYEDYTRELEMDISGDGSCEEDRCGDPNTREEIEGFASMSIKDNSHHPSATSNEQEKVPQAYDEDVCMKNNDSTAYARDERISVSCNKNQDATNNLSLTTGDVTSSVAELLSNSVPVSSNGGSVYAQKSTENSFQLNLGNEEEKNSEAEGINKQWKDSVMENRNLPRFASASPLPKVKADSSQNWKDLQLKRGQPAGISEQQPTNQTKPLYEESQQPTASTLDVNQLPAPNLEKVSQPSSVSENNDSRKPPSLRMPRFSVPKPPRVPPLPVIRPVAKGTESPKPAAPVVEIRKPPPPSPIAFRSLSQRFITHTLPPRLASTSLHQQTGRSSSLGQTGKVSTTTLSMNEANGSINSTSSVQVTGVTMPSSQQILLKNTEELPTGKTGSLTSQDAQTTLKDKEPTIQNVSKMQSTVPMKSSENGECSGQATSTEDHIFKLRATDASHAQQESKTPGASQESEPPTKSAGTPKSQGFSLNTLFGNFASKINEDEDSGEGEPRSIFSLFNVTQTTNSCEEESGNGSSFFNFGSFEDNEKSPSSEDGGPCNLFNLFSKSQNSDAAPSGFAINLSGDCGEDDGKEKGAPIFRFGGDEGKEKDSFFAFGRKGENDEEGERPLFNLF